MNGISASYVEGFCKAAEEAGVDPELLLKQALALGDIMNMGRSAARFIGRNSGRLLTAAKHPVDSAKRLYDMAGRGVKRYGELMSGGNSSVNGVYGSMDDGINMMRELWKGGHRRDALQMLGHVAKQPINALRGTFGGAAQKEMAKSLGTAVGTGAAASGGVAAIRNSLANREGQ